MLSFREYSELKDEVESLEGNLLSEDFFKLAKKKIAFEEATSHAGECNVFLAHSSKDKDELVPFVKGELSNYGGVVYLDIDDYELPQKTSEITADNLRDNIKKCGKLIVLMTKNTKNSTWVPWELGIADGLIGHNNIAILVVENDIEIDKAWINREYIGLYQIITEVEGELYVEDIKKDTKKKLSTWFFEHLNIQIN